MVIEINRNKKVIRSNRNILISFFNNEKFLILSSITLFILITKILSIYLLLSLSILISVFISLFFFGLNYYILRNNKGFKKIAEQSFTKIKLKQNQILFFLKKDGKVLQDVIFKQTENSTSALALFRIENIPLGIKDSLYKYIKSLYRHTTDFIWFYNVSTQSININQSNTTDSTSNIFEHTFFNTIEEIDNEINNKKKQSSTDIIFGHRKIVYKNLKVQEKLDNLYKHVKTSIIKTNSKLAEALPHAKIKLLTFNELKYIIKNSFFI